MIRNRSAYIGIVGALVAAFAIAISLAAPTAAQVGYSSITLSGQVSALSNQTQITAPLVSVTVAQNITVAPTANSGLIFVENVSDAYACLFMVTNNGGSAPSEISDQQASCTNGNLGATSVNVFATGGNWVVQNNEAATKNLRIIFLQ